MGSTHAKFSSVALNYSGHNITQEAVLLAGCRSCVAAAVFCTQVDSCRCWGVSGTAGQDEI